MDLKIKNRDGNELAAVLKHPKGASKIVVMCHGFTSSKDRATYVKLDEQLKNIATLRYDAIGHGESYGKPTDLTISKAVDDFIDVLDYVKNLDWVKEIGVVGSSMGGLISLLGTVRWDGKVSCLALKAPACNWIDSWKRKLGNDGLQLWKERGWVERSKIDGSPFRVSYNLFEDLEKLDAFDEAKNIDCPVCIVQGTADESVPFEDGEKLSEIIPNCEFKVIKDGDHRFTGPEQVEEFLKFTVEFFEKHL